VNGYTDFANSFFVVFVIFRKKFLGNTILEKSSGKVENLDGKKYNSGAICPEKKQNNKKIYIKK